MFNSEGLERASTKAAALAILGGVVTLASDALFIAGPGSGEIVASPHQLATFLASVSPERAALATVIGAAAIASWGMLTPALARLIAPAGTVLQWMVVVLHVWFVGLCVAFHVATGCVAWIGHLGSSAEHVNTTVGPLWSTLRSAMGTTMLALAATLALASWRARPNIPWSMSLVSPLFAFSVFSVPSRFAPAPYGAALAMLASTAGGLIWLTAVWAWSRSRSNLS